MMRCDVGLKTATEASVNGDGSWRCGGDTDVVTNMQRTCSYVASVELRCGVRIVKDRLPLTGGGERQSCPQETALNDCDDTLLRLSGCVEEGSKV